MYHLQIDEPASFHPEQAVTRELPMPYSIFATLLGDDDTSIVMVIDSQAILILFIEKKSGGQASVPMWMLMTHAPSIHAPYILSLG